MIKDHEVNITFNYEKTVQLLDCVNDDINNFIYHFGDFISDHNYDLLATMFTVRSYLMSYCEERLKYENQD